MTLLVRHRDFRRLLVGNSVSLLGSSVTTVALPLAAVVALHASPIEMGLLGAAALLPHLVLGLPAGVWVDRLPYKRILVLADLGQLLLIGSVPLAAVFGVLTLAQLYAVVVLAGVCALFDAVAGQSFTPMLVPREQLLPANSALMLTSSTVDVAGSALGSGLVVLLAAPLAVAVDAASFLVAALCKLRIATPGVPAASVRRKADLFGGLRIAFTHPVLRPVTIAATLGAADLSPDSRRPRPAVPGQRGLAVPGLRHPTGRRCPRRPARQRGPAYDPPHQCRADARRHRPGAAGHAFGLTAVPHRLDGLGPSQIRASSCLHCNRNLRRLVAVHEMGADGVGPKMLADVTPPFIPEGASVMTALVEWPPGHPGTPPHRHSGPCFGYVLEGAIRFELEGEPEVVIKAGETLYEPGGDQIHYQNGNASGDEPARFVVTMLCAPGAPMLTLVDDEELAQRAYLRAPRP